MNETQVESLVAAAKEGIDFDGLSVACDDGGYAVSAPGFERDGLSADELREAAGSIEPFLTNWYYWTSVVSDLTDARYAFLRWLERADERGVKRRYADLGDGIVRSWGQLSIAVRIGRDGRREYELRNEADAGAGREELDVYTDPLDARELVRFDDRGRYRPLKTAPTLPTGWAFDLDGTGLVRAIDFVYPATVENWHLERRGELDVTHWRGAADRQTGIYEAVSELDPEAVAWAVEACCVDSVCLKRRRWDFDENGEIDVERGDGEFPCREPCSFLVAAAREWALAEREEERTYEFELTPGEREQVEAIVDAVAEGRIEEIREAEFADPANRYRARYLRAKRFGDAADSGDSRDG